ncbi:MAG: TIGR04552 family protein [Polyangiales bacterium]
MPPPVVDSLKPLHDWSLADLESVRLLLRGESVIDWHRLNLESDDDVRAILSGNEFSLDDPDDVARTERIKDEAIDYLRRHFEFPIPKSTENLTVQGLMMQASGKGHRQLCACTILKCMHVIHHLEGRELRYNLTLSDQEMFRLVEEKIYRVVGGMLAAGLPITEFVGGRKNKYSLYTKLLSKQDNIAAQIYDKQRFRIVTRSQQDIFPVLLYLARRLFAFNYVIPGQSTNTVFALKSYCDEHPRLAQLAKDPRANEEERDDLTPSGNAFSADSYRIIHFVVDLPVRVPDRILAKAPASARHLGSVIFALVEFQILDRETEASNETGDASHDRYKERQRQAVMRRMKLGARGLQVHDDDAKNGTPSPPPVGAKLTEK